MTRLKLFSSLLAAPLAAAFGVRSAKADAGEDSVVFAPGTITIAPGGGITITGTQGVKIEGCTFSPRV